MAYLFSHRGCYYRVVDCGKWVDVSVWFDIFDNYMSVVFDKWAWTPSSPTLDASINVCIYPIDWEKMIYIGKICLQLSGHKAYLYEYSDLLEDNVFIGRPDIVDLCGLPEDYERRDYEEMSLLSEEMSFGDYENLSDYESYVSLESLPMYDDDPFLEPISDCESVFDFEPVPEPDQREFNWDENIEPLEVESKEIVKTSNSNVPKSRRNVFQESSRKAQGKQRHELEKQRKKDIKHRKKNIRNRRPLQPTIYVDLS